MNFGKSLVTFSLDHPRTITAIMALMAAAFGLAAILPTVAPEVFPFLYPVSVDTDPENMLSPDQPVRVFHNEMKRVMGLHDMVVLGAVNDTHPNGVFHPASLREIYELTEYAKTLRGNALGKSDPSAGIVVKDLIAPSTVDNIEQGGPGTVKLEWLMPSPPETDAEAFAVRDKALKIPFLNGTLVSEDGKAICLYLPITAKDLSHAVYTRLLTRIREVSARPDASGNQYYITGMPVAEDVFGVEMFKQMAISAPLAMLVIFLLMLYFFRKLILIISPMVLALVSVIFTMGALVVTGNTIHIMSSMIPIFIMPIAVLDSIHILSEFFERYQHTRNRRETIGHVMDTLFTPMLYTSLTSVAGFASLALTPIPPVQVFGIFVGVGVAFAWVLTVTFIPAYVMLLPERRLEDFGSPHGPGGAHEKKTLADRFLTAVSRFTYSRAKLVIVASVIVAVVAAYGISLIRVNDNPTKWFRASHGIRVADRVLNAHFGGTYMAYLSLSPVIDGQPERPPMPLDTTQPDEDRGSSGPSLPAGMAQPSGTPALPEGLGSSVPPSEPALPAGLGGGPTPSESALPAGLGGAEPLVGQIDLAPPAADERAGIEVFLDPAVLRYMEGLQQALVETGAVGKSNSLTDIVKTVHRELIDGTAGQFRVPDSPEAVAQCLTQYQGGHRPDDLWHFVTPDFRHSSIWVQLRSGDNLDMQQVVEAIDAYVEANPLTFTIEGNAVTLQHQWFGKTYLNVVWQERMVSGMLNAFLGSFLVVLLMMIVLFGSGLWGLLSMIPLTVTIGLIYGVIGLIGKDYDMPVAVLSSLTLGLAVDFAIHFLARARALHERHGSWAEAYVPTFGEPARAIMKNIIVIAVGFLPLLLAPLVPYNTVGVFLASILMASGIATLVILPALIRVLEPLLFPKTRVCSVTCRCGTCVVTGVTAILVVWVNVYQFMNKGWTWFTVVSILLLAVLIPSCCIMSRRAKCKPKPESDACAS